MPSVPARSGLPPPYWPLWHGSLPRPVTRPALAMSKQGLSGQLLPRHIKPQADELLSSWLTRLRWAHGLGLRAFCTILWPATPIWVGDIDHRATLDMLSILAEKTALSRRRVFATPLS